MNRLKFGMGIVGLAMVASTVFKDEIEPAREAARGLQDVVLAVVVKEAVQAPMVSPAIK